MNQKKKGVSTGVYRYTHRCEAGADIHDVFVHKSVQGAVFLFGCSSPSCECLSRLAVEESLIIMPAFGVQLEQHYWSGRVHRQFVPISKILKPVLNECVTPVTCYWSLALLLRDEDEIMLVFKKLNPPLKMLVPIWKALCAFTHSDCISPSVVLRPDSLHQHVVKGGAPES